MQLQIGIRVALATTLFGLSVSTIAAVPVVADGPVLPGTTVPGKPAGTSALHVFTATVTSTNAQNVMCPGTASFVGTATGTPGKTYTFFFQSNFNGTPVVQFAPTSFVMPASGTQSGPFTVNVPNLTNGTNTVELSVTDVSAGETKIATLPVTCYSLPAPTNVKELKTQSDCNGAVGTTEQPGCYATIASGGLALKFDEPKSVDGFRFYRVDGGRHDPVTALTFPNSKYLLVPSTSGPFPGRCYAVEAYQAALSSQDSDRFCATASSVAKTIDLYADHAQTIVRWAFNNPIVTPAVAAGSGISPGALLTYQLRNLEGPPSMIPFFPTLQEITSSIGSMPVEPGLIAGGENFRYPPAPASSEPFLDGTSIGSRFGLAFDLKNYAGDTIYEATLQFDPFQDLLMPAASSRGTNLSAPGVSCANVVGAANAKWWEIANWDGFTMTDSEPLTTAGSKSVSTDVTKYVADWAKNNDAGDYGFVIDGEGDTFAQVPQSPSIGTCLTSYYKPVLKLVYF